MQTYIDSVQKERAQYPELNNSYSENVSNIAVDSDSVIPQKKICFRGETYEENEANKSMNTRETIDTSKKMYKTKAKTLNKLRAKELGITRAKQLKREQKNSS